MNKKIINLFKSPLDTWSINDHTGKVSVNQEHTVEARQTLPNKGPFSPRWKGRKETTPSVWKNSSKCSEDFWCSGFQHTVVIFFRMKDKFNDSWRLLLIRWFEDAGSKWHRVGRAQMIPS